MGTPGLGWRFVKDNLCCEEAEALAGIPGACSGSKGGGGGGKGGKTGYIGCYKDPNNPFDLDGFLQRSSNNTPQRCIETCRAKGFAYAGVQYGQSCLCGNSYGKFGEASNCNMKCTGDSSQICGGYNANSVYGTGVGSGNDGGDKGGGGDACSCKNGCPDCAGLPSLLCVVEGESPKARACRQCMNRCQNGGNGGGGSFAGGWYSSEWGNLTFEQNGNQVTGRYSSPGGSIWGSVSGNRMTVSWRNDAGGKVGEAYFVLKSDGSLEGKWCYNSGCNPENGTYFTGTKR